jgi:sarcosine oxidase subunit gamma
MADLRAQRRGPLDAVALPATDKVAVTISPAASRFVLRGAADIAAAASAVFGVALPQHLNRAEGQGRVVIMIGPDEWLLIAENEDTTSLGQKLEAAMADRPHSLVDISHRQIGFDVKGRLATLALSSGCPLDMRRDAFPIGMATRTIFHKAEIILWRQAEDCFRIEVWRSFAPYLIGHVKAACDGAADL